MCILFIKKKLWVKMNLFDFKFFFELEGFKNSSLFNNNVNVWNSLLNISVFFKDKIFKNNAKHIPSSCFLKNPETIFIGDNSIIEPGSYIQGPCYIGDNCQVRHGAYIRNNVIIGDGCIIGHCTEVKNSILLNNVHASHFAYIGDSILGNNVNLGAGVRCANYRLDKKNISFYFKNEKIDTGLKKLGAIIGDNSQIGCNTVLNPATFMGKNVICYANINVGGYIMSDSIIKPTNKIIIKQLKSRDSKNERIVSVEK